VHRRLAAGAWAEKEVDQFVWSVGSERKICTKSLLHAGVVAALEKSRLGAYLAWPCRAVFSIVVINPLHASLFPFRTNNHPRRPSLLVQSIQSCPMPMPMLVDVPGSPIQSCAEYSTEPSAIVTQYRTGWFRLSTVQCRLRSVQKPGPLGS
jgi:hypothetical protein